MQRPAVAPVFHGRLAAFVVEACRHWLIVSLGCVAFLSSTLAALPQVPPSQVTPDTLRPKAERAPIGFESSTAAELQAPAGAQSLSFIVGHVVIDGEFLDLESEISGLVDAIEGSRITVAEVFAFANAVEQVYWRAGYVLVRVTVPPQSLNDHGSLRLVVVDGFIERIDADKVPSRVRALVTAQLSSIVGRRHIKLASIERRLLVAGGVPGLRLRSTLARGASPGGTLLVLDATHRLITASASVDNLLQDSLGNWQYGTSVQINSPLGFGEQFYGSAQTAGAPLRIFDPNSPLLVLGGGVIIPLGREGWMLNPEYTYSRSQPAPAMGSPDSVGYFQRIAIRTWYPLVLMRARTVMLTGAFEAITQNVALPLFATDLNRDRYGVLRFGVATESELPSGAGLQTSTTFSWGLGGRDRAEATASGIPLSRQGAGPSFVKANVDAHFTSPLPKGFRVDLTGRGQTSFGEPLLVSEQFSLEGPRAVSAYPTGALSVDEGATFRGELSRPFALSGFVAPVVVEPYGFGAVGVGALDEPTIDEVAAVRAGAVGVGVRSFLGAAGGHQGATFELEAARQFSNVPILAQGWRGNLSVRLRF